MTSHNLIKTIPAIALGAALLLAGTLTPVGTANAQAVSLDELLQQVKQGRVRDSQENAAREQRFDNGRMKYHREEWRR